MGRLRSRKPDRCNHTSWVAYLTPTDRPKSVRNCVYSKVLGGVLFCHFTFLVFSLNVRGLVIGLSQISSFLCYLYIRKCDTESSLIHKVLLFIWRVLVRWYTQCYWTWKFLYINEYKLWYDSEIFFFFENYLGNFSLFFSSMSLRFALTFGLRSV